MSTSKRKQAPDPIAKLIGGNLRAVRLSHGLTMKELGKPIEISPQQIGKYERGEDRVAASTLWRLSELLHSRVTRFYTRLEPGDRPGLAEVNARFDRTGAPSSAAGLIARLAIAPLATQRRVIRKALVELSSQS